MARALSSCSCSASCSWSHSSGGDGGVAVAGVWLAIRLSIEKGLGKGLLASLVVGDSMVPISPFCSKAGRSILPTQKHTFRAIETNFFLLISQRVSVPEQTRRSEPFRDLRATVQVQQTSRTRTAPKSKPRSPEAPSNHHHGWSGSSSISIWRMTNSWCLCLARAPIGQLLIAGWCGQRTSFRQWSSTTTTSTTARVPAP